MKAPISLILFFFIFIQEMLCQSNERCIASETRQSWWAAHPKLYQEWLKQQEEFPQEQAEQLDQFEKGQLVTIPVVVHILWNTPEQNLSDEDVITQIDVLNKDFRALNDEVPNIPLLFQPLIADVEMEFCLATKDPNGQVTTGITRKFTNNDVGIGGTSAIHYSGLGGVDAWDPSRYLNIWVAKFAGGVSGTSSFPGQGPPEEDGVEINYQFFGTISSEMPYHLGRTLTHEVGHYFNLEHPWGPNVTDCCGNDFVADTPEACEIYLGQCPAHPVVSCFEPDLFMNYMFYTDDACMGMFTLGQKARMLAALTTFRAGLINAGNCATSTNERLGSESIVVFPNPAQDYLNFELDMQGEEFESAAIVDDYGRTVLSFEPVRGSNKVQFEDLPAGSYVLLLKNSQQLLSAHFLKM